MSGERREIGPDLARRVRLASVVLEENARLRAEIARLRLTDAEREAVESCIADDEAATAYARADVLRELLKRLESDRHIGG
jgi:hypothetical protein